MFEVSNQPPPLEPYNLFASDAVLRAAVKREQADWAEVSLTALGATLGKPETIQLGFEANKYPPTLRPLDRFGHRIDEVEFHPAWHELLAIAIKAGLRAGLFICVAFRALRFIARSPKKYPEAANVPEHRSSCFVVSPGNEHTGG